MSTDVTSVNESASFADINELAANDDSLDLQNFQITANNDDSEELLS